MFNFRVKTSPRSPELVFLVTVPPCTFHSHFLAAILGFPRQTKPEATSVTSIFFSSAVQKKATTLISPLQNAAGLWCQLGKLFFCIRSFCVMNFFSNATTRSSPWLGRLDGTLGLMAPCISLAGAFLSYKLKTRIEHLLVLGEAALRTYCGGETHLQRVQTR